MLCLVLCLQCPVTQELERAFEAAAQELKPEISVGRVRQLHFLPPLAAQPL